MERTDRISHLKEYYLTHSPMVLDRKLAPWKCHRTLYLYVEGWLQNVQAPTLRLRRSMAEAYLLKHTKPVILEKELLVGQPDFSPFSKEEQEKYEQYCFLKEKVIPECKGRADHMALDYEKLLKYGIKGVMAQIREKLDKINVYDGREAEKLEFYQCLMIELEGGLVLAENYKNHALTLAKEAKDVQREEYLTLAKILERVPALPARTFREALQSIQLFTFSLYGIYSAGRPDQYLYPYYKADIENGTLTEAEAQELIDCFFLQYMNNMSSWAAASLMIGGRDGEGRAVENELTFAFLRAIKHTHLPDPNVGLCVTGETSDKLLHYAAELIRAGYAQPQIWNNDGVTKSMLHYGYDPKAANLFSQSTCVELTPIACSGVSITSPYINMLKIFLHAFEKCNDSMGFEEIFETFRVEFEEYCKRVLTSEHLYQLERRRNATDPVRISAFVNDCIERGLSTDSGGAEYNDIEPNMLGMTNVIESLNVIETLVFKLHRLTVEQFISILRDDYVGHEDILAYIRNKVPHFGTDTEESNALAKRVADTVLKTLGKFTTFRGAHFVPGAFSYRDHELHGRRTPASPDGRRAGDVLADGSSPVQGYDHAGPTASLSSTLSWKPLRFLGGIAVNVKLTSDVSTEHIIELIRTYIDGDGLQIQFNVVDRDVLFAAQKHPEQYADLLVRIGGYSDYFTKIPRRLQDDIISRSQS